MPIELIGEDLDDLVDELGAYEELVGEDDDEDDLEDFLGIMGADDEDDEDDDDEEVGARVSLRGLVRAMKRRKGRRRRGRRRVRRGVRRGWKKGSLPRVARVAGTKGRRIPFGNSAAIATTATGNIVVTAQEPFRPDTIRITGYDAVAFAAIPPEVIQVNNIQVGTRSQLPSIGPMDGTMFARDFFANDAIAGFDTVQPGTQLTANVTNNHTANGVFYLQGFGRALR